MRQAIPGLLAPVFWVGGLSAESLPDLGVSIPSTMGQNGRDMPQPWSNHQEGAMPTENQHVPSASARLRSRPAAASALQQALKGIEGEMRNEACVLWEKLAEQAFR